MRRWHAFALAASVLVLWLLMGAVVSGEPFLPLSIGNYWDYEELAGEFESRSVNRTEVMWGDEVYSILYEQSPANEGLENYWTSGPDDDVLLWGFYRWPELWGLAYKPPIAFLDAPTFPGKTWTCTTHMYTLPDTTNWGVLVVSFHVFEEGMLTVPAGSFFAVGVEQVPPGPPGGPLDVAVALDGRLLWESPQRAWENWYSRGVGAVQYVDVETYQLIDYGLVTGVDATSWGRIKAVFRE